MGAGTSSQARCCNHTGGNEEIILEVVEPASPTENKSVHVAEESVPDKQQAFKVTVTMEPEIEPEKVDDSPQESEPPTPSTFRGSSSFAKSASSSTLTTASGGSSVAIKICEEATTSDMKSVPTFSPEDFSSGKCVPGLDVPDQDEYPAVLQMVKDQFQVKLMALFVLLPVVMNSVWMSVGNLVNDGQGLQNLYYFMFCFDSYFMLLKGTMISAYFHVFMPPSVVKPKHWVHAVLAFAFPLSSIAIHFVWIGLGTIHSKENWVLMKLNFPAGATVALVGFMPLYLWVSFAKGERFFAFKRYVLLVVVLVGDLFFIATSHVYVYYFFEYQKGKILSVPDSWIGEKLVELAWVACFGQLYMPLLGKIWQFAILLIDLFAPMKDLQRQRLFNFATVILDMHRIMYAREIFTGLKSYDIFVLLVLKDWVYDIWQFGVKALPATQTQNLILADTSRKRGTTPRLLKSRARETFARVAFRLMDLLECPKQVMSVFKWNIDASYAGAQPTSFTKCTFFFCDQSVQIKRLPSIFHTGEAGDTQYSELASVTQEWKKMMWDSAAEVALEPILEKRFQILEKKLQKKRFPILEKACPSNKKGSPWDQFHAIAFDQLPFEASSITKSASSSFENPAIVDFYRLVNMQICALVYTRWRIRGAIRLCSALMFTVTGFMIRLSPSSDVMNTIIDHTDSLPVKLWVFGAIFLVSDLLKEWIIQSCQYGDNANSAYSLRHFARLFVNPMYYYMILSCFVCCNSDVFLTFPVLKFGGA